MKNLRFNFSCFLPKKISTRQKLNAHFDKSFARSKGVFIVQDNSRGKLTSSELGLVAADLK